jgi:hypothetical protein
VPWEPGGGRRIWSGAPGLLRLRHWRAFAYSRSSFRFN